MVDRLVEALAVYGGIMLVLVVLVRRATKDDIMPMIIAWTLITWIPGVIYIILGILPGQ